MRERSEMLGRPYTAPASRNFRRYHECHLVGRTSTFNAEQWRGTYVMAVPTVR